MVTSGPTTARLRAWVSASCGIAALASATVTLRSPSLSMVCAWARRRMPSGSDLLTSRMWASTPVSYGRRNENKKMLWMIRDVRFWWDQLDNYLNLACPSYMCSFHSYILHLPVLLTLTSPPPMHSLFMLSLANCLLTLALYLSQRHKWSMDPLTLLS